ncbi:MAG: zinc ribbon domain-containing protein [Spirochaetales bacterium]|nr:zinc ribbon domain-containing protein [Spirochaetales bacterium]
MAICKECNVAIEGNAAQCPLCGTPLYSGKKSSAKKIRQEPVVEPAAEKKGNYRVLRFMAWEIISVLLGFILIIILLTNFLIEFTLTWALLPAGALVFAWLLASIPLLLGKAPLRISVFSAVSVMLFLAFLDFIQDYTISWFYIIAIPIFILVSTVSTAIFIAVLFSKKRGINIAAYILFGMGIILAGIDLIISYSIYHSLALGWSLFVIIPAGFTAIFLLYIHFRISKAGDIRKWFQI